MRHFRSSRPLLCECRRPFVLPRPAAASTDTSKRELSLPNAMCQLNSGNGDGRIRERFEPSHRCATPLDRAVVLLDQVVEVLVRAHLDVPPARVFTSQQPQCAPTRHMTVESHFAWDAWSVCRERLAKECLSGRNSTVAAEQEIDGLAMLVDRAVKVVPLRSDRDVRFIDSPRRANGSRESVPALLELRNVTSDPPKDRQMRDFDAALGHHLHKISIRQPISDVPAHAQLDDVGVEYAFTVHRVTRDRLRHSAPPANKIRQSIRCPWMHQNLRSKSRSFGLENVRLTRHVRMRRLNGGGCSRRLNRLCQGFPVSGNNTGNLSAFSARDLTVR